MLWHTGTYATILTNKFFWSDEEFKHFVHPCPSHDLKATWIQPSLPPLRQLCWETAANKCGADNGTTAGETSVWKGCHVVHPHCEDSQLAAAHSHRPMQQTCTTNRKSIISRLKLNENHTHYNVHVVIGNIMSSKDTFDPKQLSNCEVSTLEEAPDTNIWRRLPNTLVHIQTFWNSAFPLKYSNLEKVYIESILYIKSQSINWNV